MEIMEADALKIYSLKIDAATGEVVGEYSQDAERADEALDAKVRRYMADHNTTYDVAFHAVVQDPRHRDLIRAYAGVPD